MISLHCMCNSVHVIQKVKRIARRISSRAVCLYTPQSIYCKNSMNLHLTKVIYCVINKLSSDLCLHSDPQFITIKVGCCCCQHRRLRGQIQEQIWAEMEPLWILVFTSQPSTKSVLLPHRQTLTISGDIDGGCLQARHAITWQQRRWKGHMRACTHTHTLSQWVSNESRLLSLFWQHTAITLN